MYYAIHVHLFVQFRPELDTRGITMASVTGVLPTSVQTGNNEKESSKN